MNELVTFVGFKSSGKNTAAQPLIDHYGFAALSFADAMKDALAAIFCWPREMLEGITAESRAWRENIDPWWADRLDIPEFSPRWALRHFGSDVMRQHFHPEIWVLNVERRMTLLADRPIVIIDARFPNEIALARRFNSRVARIKRGPDPLWADTAAEANQGDAEAIRWMATFFGDVHESERAWIGSTVDVTLTNDGSINQLHQSVVNWLNLDETA